MLTRYKGRKFIIPACTYAVLVVLALLMLPGAPVIGTAVAMVLLSVLVCAIYKETSAYVPSGVYALFLASFILSLGVIANVFYFTTQSGGTCSDPILQNFDAGVIWGDCNAHYGIGNAFRPARFYYGVIIAALMKVFGHSIVVPLVANMFCMQIALLLGALMTYRITEDKRTSVVAIIAAMSICFYMSMGTVLLKDSWVIMATALAAYGLIRSDKKGVALFAVAALIMMCVKPSYLLALAVGAAALVLPKKLDKRNAMLCVALVALCVLLWKLPIWLGMPDMSKGYLTTGTPTYGEEFNDGLPQHQAYFSILGNFFEYPLYKRIMLLPITAGVQFFIPFPWNFSRDVVFGYSQVYAHIAYPWYLFGSVVIYYFIFACRRLPRQLLWLSLWAMFCWLVPCVMHGGTVSRYALPTVTLFAPCVAVVLTRFLRKRSFVIWTSAFVIALAILLPICYILQNSAL